MLLKNYIRQILAEAILNKLNKLNEAVDKDKIIDLYNQGTPVKELAKLFKIKSSSVYNIISALRKQGHEITQRKAKVEHEEFVRVFNTLKTHAKVAEYFNISTGSVNKIANYIRDHKPELGIKNFSKASLHLGDEELVKLANESNSVSEFANKSGITVTQARHKLQHLRRLGYKIKKFQASIVRNKEAMQLLGILSDEDIAAMTGANPSSVRDIRVKLGIPLAKAHLSKDLIKFYLEHIFELWQFIPDEFELSKLIHIAPNKVINEIEKNPHARPKNEHYAKQVISFINRWNNAQSVKAFIRETLLRRDKVLELINQLRALKINVKKHVDEQN